LASNLPGNDSEVAMALENPETELIELERQYWQAIKDKDLETARRLTDFPCIVAGARGVGRIDAESFGRMMSDAGYTLHDFDLKDVQVRLLADDVVLVAYKVHERLTVGEREVELDAADASTWVRRDGQWRCALHTEALSGDPFGRDRSARATP
jgi:hypothetical protein